MVGRGQACVRVGSHYHSSDLIVVLLYIYNNSLLQHPAPLLPLSAPSSLLPLSAPSSVPAAVITLLLLPYYYPHNVAHSISRGVIKYANVSSVTAARRAWCVAVRSLNTSINIFFTSPVSNLPLP